MTRYAIVVMVVSLEVAISSLATPRLARAQTEPTYTPRDFTDCSKGPCSAAQALTYLLWSRESDRNDCRNLLTPFLGVEPARTRCNTIVRGNNPAASIDEFGVVDGIRGVISTQTRSLPVASSSAGLVFGQSSGSAYGELTRSLGPLFAERPVTSGGRTLSVSAVYQGTRWTAIDGNSLHDIYTYEAQPGVAKDLARCASDIQYCPSQRWATDLGLRTQSLNFGVTWGALPVLDVGLAIPVLKVSVFGRSTRSTKFNPLNPTGTVDAEAGASGISYGIGDIPIRAKWMFVRPATCTEDCGDVTPTRGVLTKGRHTNAAAIGELRVPSGSREKMTGTGAWQTKIGLALAYNLEPKPLDWRQAIWPGPSFHTNVGYTFAGGGTHITNTGQGASNQYAGDFTIEPSDEIAITFGADVPIVPTDRGVTMSFDYIGRVLSRGARYYNVLFLGKNTFAESQPFLREDRWVPLHLMTVGGKFRFAKSWLASGNVLWAKGDNGLRPGLTVVASIERVRDAGPPKPKSARR